MTPTKVLYPPRPKSKITPDQLLTYEQRGDCCVQYKYNGTRSLFYIPTDHSLSGTFMINRHGQFHKQFVPNKNFLNQVLSLNLEKGKDYWLDGELLHAKTVNPIYKSRVVLYDVLYCGKYLHNKNYKQRLEMLNDICRNPKELEPNQKIALTVTPNIWLAPTFYNNFLNRYNDLIQYDEIEGVVVKMLNSFLDGFGQKQVESSWLIRCRKPHSSGSYSF
jgi:hypothetical protein